MDQDTKPKIIVGAVVMIVVLFIVIYGVIAFGGEKKTKKQSDKVAFSAPKLEKKEYEYNRRIDLVNEKGYVPEQKIIIQEDTSEINADNHIENPFLSNIEKVKHEPQLEKKPQNTALTKKHTVPTEKVQYASEASTTSNKPVEQETTRRRKERHLNNLSSSDSPSSFKVSETIPCSVYGVQRVTSNSKLMARITEDVTLNGVKIKRNTIITGIVQLSNSKVNIRFETIQYENKTIPANMKAYSRDGLEGIYIEGGVGDDVKKDVYEDIVDAASPSTVDRIPIVGGILKATVKKQNNKVYVDIPNDYTIYLRK